MAVGPARGGSGARGGQGRLGCASGPQHGATGIRIWRPARHPPDCPSLTGLASQAPGRPVKTGLLTASSRAPYEPLTASLRAGPVRLPEAACCLWLPEAALGACLWACWESLWTSTKASSLEALSLQVSLSALKRRQLWPWLTVAVTVQLTSLTSPHLMLSSWSSAAAPHSPAAAAPPGSM